MSNENPFSAPVADELSADNESESNDGKLMAMAKAVFLAWEKLRVYYNLVLVAETILLGWFTSTIYAFEFWLVAVPGGLGANVCFLIGPAVETYVRWLGFGGLWVRNVLFLLGLLFSATLVIIFVAALGFQ